jgi:hypothetical protein
MGVALYGHNSTAGLRANSCVVAKSVKFLHVKTNFGDFGVYMEPSAPTRGSKCQKGPLSIAALRDQPQ